MTNKLIDPESLKLLIMHTVDVIKYVQDESKVYGNVQITNLSANTLANMDEIISELSAMAPEITRFRELEVSGVSDDKLSPWLGKKNR